MKKLLLVSNSDFLYKHLQDFVEKPLKDFDIAWITTAKKGSPNKEFVERHRQKMTELGWNFEEIDIEGKTEDELRELLINKDIVYVHGGNTFYLLKVIKSGAFEKILKEKMEKGMLYVGVSAGAYITCPTIEMSEWKLDRKYEKFAGQDLTAMNLVPFLVSVHFENNQAESIRAGIKKTHLDVYVLTDDQALYIEDGKVTLIGDQERVMLD